MKNFEYKKSLGQNFLIDKNIVRKIVDSIDLEDKSLIIEVGPGNGALTKELVKLKANVISFEIDKRLKEDLDKLVEENKNLEVIFEDFLELDLNKFLKTKKYKNLYFVANLPYYITSAIVNKITEESKPNEMILMVQKEVAERFSAKPNTKSYGSMSVFLQYNYNISKVVSVPKTCFYPSPKVDSMVIKFKTNNNKEKPINEKLFYKIIKESFKFKRKNLRNNLRNNLKDYDLEIINEVLKKYNKDLSFRAENLSVSEFIDISNNLNY